MTDSNGSDTPMLDQLEEGPLRLRQRPVDRGHEQHQIGPRDELGGDPFVLAHDRDGLLPD